MNKSDELRSRLPSLAGEMNYAISIALRNIRKARAIAQHTQGDVGLAWRKGLDDALLMLRDVDEANKQFNKWQAEVLAQEVDACGLTAEERDQVLRIAGK